MRNMKNNRIGKSDVFVSQIGLGTAPLANLYHAVSEAQAVETIQRSLENGVNYFDTAPFYGSGLAEKRLGLALAGIARDQYLISTKVGRLIQPDGNATFEFSRAGILRSIEESLKRLQMDSIDILLIHDPDDYFRQTLEEAYPVLNELRNDGVVKAIGVGMNQWKTLADFAQHAEFDCFMLAGRYTLLEQEALGFLNLCHAKGIGILMAGIFNSGILASGPTPDAKYNYSDAPPEIMERARRLQSVCQLHNVPLKAAALQFPLSHPATTCLVLGIDSPTQLADNMASLEMQIPPDLWLDLQREGLIDDEVPMP